MGAVREIRGIPLLLLREYLLELGAAERADGALATPTWTARLLEAEDHTVGSLRIGQVRLEMHGDTAALEAALEPKLLRGGG